MKFNARTIGLLLGSIVIIALVLFSNNQQASTPAATGTPTAAAEGAGPIFPAIADVNNQGGITRFQVEDTASGQRVVMTKDAANVWTITESGAPSDLATDQTRAVGTMSALASLAATQRFPLADGNLADFGLEAPGFVLTLTDSANVTYVARIGAANPATRRYYALVNDDAATIYVLPQDVVDNLTRQITQPPYVPSPTPTVTPTQTPNPVSEVDQTATAAVELTAFAVTLTAIAEVTPEATGEATAEAAAAESTAEATTAPSATPVPPTATRVPASVTPVPPTATPSVTPIPPTRTPSVTPVPPTRTPSVTPTATATPR